MKQVCRLDEKGYFVDIVYTEKSPLEPDVYLLPGGCIDVSPPHNIPKGYRAKWENESWVFEKIPLKKPDQPEDSWIYNEEKNIWNPPSPRPGLDYVWNETLKSWQTTLTLSGHKQDIRSS